MVFAPPMAPPEPIDAPPRAGLEPFPDLPPWLDEEDAAYMPPPDPADMAPIRKPFPTRFLPPSLRRYVESVALSVGADASMVAAPLLSVLAASIGNARVFRAGPDWAEPSVVWTAVINAPGEKKSPSLDAALSFFHERDAATYAKYDLELSVYKDAAQRYERAAKARKPDSDAPTECPVEPVCPTLIVNDATGEALAERLEKNPRGLLCAHDELAAALKGNNAYRGGRGGDVERMLSFHGARPVRIDRKHGRQTLRIDRAAVSFTGGVQHGILRGLLTENGGQYANNGMLARFLFTMPPTDGPLTLETPAIDAEARANVSAIIDNLLSLMPPPPPPGFAAPSPAAVSLDDNARGVFDWFRTKLHRMKSETDPEDPLRAVYPKIEAAAVRLAGILHLARHADPANDKPTDPAAIDERAMLAGVLLADWFAAEAKRVYVFFKLSGEAKREPDDAVKRIHAHLTAAGGRVRVREIYRKYGRRLGWTCAEMARTWLSENFQADGLATFERVGKSDWLIAADAPTPPKDDEEDDE